jgi:hypothetical protein
MIRLNSRPRPSVNDCGDSADRYAKSIRERLHADDALLVCGPDVSDGIFCEDSHWVVRPTVSRPIGFVPTLGDAVLSVVPVCPKKQMARINTRRVIALVADLHPIRDRAVVQFPRDPVSPNVLPIFPENSVALGHYGTGPEPASVSLADLRSEANIERDLSSSHSWSIPE